MAPDKPSIRRCAIYTRKSSEEGLEQDFNSLHAQREACEAFIRSQVGEGWRPIKTHYDDGGLSGGTMERAALQRLLADIRQGLIDVLVVYKVDRLTRSLADFAKMVEVFDAHQVSFVAVTQQFNTTTSMGRLTLNVLLSFAQFEREVTGERIRDKIAASKKKGIWMGGLTPLGYDAKERRLVVNRVESETVRHIYQRYLELGSVRLLREELERTGIVSKVRTSQKGTSSGGCPFSRGALYELLANPIYVGEIRHKKERHRGQHDPIIDRAVWEKVQQSLQQKAVRTGKPNHDETRRALSGKLFDEKGQPLNLCATRKNGRQYRYYVSRALTRGEPDPDGRGWRLAASEIERTVSIGVAQILRDEPTIANTLHAAGVSTAGIDSAQKAIKALSTGIEAAPAEACASLSPLLNRVALLDTGLELSLLIDSLLPEGSTLGGSTPMKITRLVPLRLKRRGIETRLVIEGENSRVRPIDPALLKAVARGHRWFKDLASGTAADTLEIAKREHVPDNYVRRLIPLAFLSPSLVEAICSGRQPATLTAEMLKRTSNLPCEWRKQQDLFAAL